MTALECHPAPRRRRSRARPGAAPVGSEEWRARVAEGTRRALAERRRREEYRREQERERARVQPRDLERLERSGVVVPALAPLLGIAFEEARDLTAQLGGPDVVTPAQRILIEDLAAIGIALRACLALFTQATDPEIASRLATLAGARRASLLALGLERLERPVPDLASYLRSRGANGSGAPIDTEVVGRAPTRGRSPRKRPATGPRSARDAARGAPRG